MTLEKVKKNTGFAIDAAPSLETTQEPTDQELELLRTKVDPRRYVIGRA